LHVGRRLIGRHEVRRIRLFCLCFTHHDERALVSGMAANQFKGAFTGLPGPECGEGGPTAGPQALSLLLQRECEM
jgi:hypothetical protein